MSHSIQHTCGDCHFIALKRHFSKCRKSCTACDFFDRLDYVCRNHVRDYCINENVIGKIDRTYPACDAEFMLSSSRDEGHLQSPEITVTERPPNVFSWEIGARKWAETAGRPKKGRS